MKLFLAVIALFFTVAFAVDLTPLKAAVRPTFSIHSNNTNSPSSLELSSLRAKLLLVRYVHAPSSSNPPNENKVVQYNVNPEISIPP